MEIYAREEGGEEAQLLCRRCGSAGLEPIGRGGATGAPTWSLMSRLAASCKACGEENHVSWGGRVRFLGDDVTGMPQRTV